MSIKFEQIYNSIKKNNKKIQVSIEINDDFIQQINNTNKSSNTFLNVENNLLDKLNITNLDLSSYKNESIIEEVAENKGNNLIYYKSNEVIELPSSINNILELKNFYTFGVNKKLSFLDSIFMILDPNYTLQTPKDKLKILNEMLIHLLQELDTNFKDFGYRKKGHKKTVMKEKLEKSNLDDNSLKLYIADVFKVNIISLDLVSSNYYIHNYHDVSKKNVVLIKQGELYFPIVHILGKVYDSNILDIIDKNYKNVPIITNKSNLELKSNVDGESKKELDNNNNTGAELDNNNTVGELETNNETTFDKELVSFDKFWKYNLKQLQDLATNLDISLVENGKKKTKKQLYDEILIILK